MASLQTTLPESLAMSASGFACISAQFKVLPFVTMMQFCHVDEAINLQAIGAVRHLETSRPETGFF